MTRILNKKAKIMLFHNEVGAPKCKKFRDQTWNSESGKQVAYDLNMVTQAKYHYLKFLLIRIFTWMFVLINFCWTIWLWWKQNIAPSMLSYDQSRPFFSWFSSKCTNFYFFCHDYGDAQVFSNKISLISFNFVVCEIQIFVATLRLLHLGSH